MPTLDFTLNSGDCGTLFYSRHNQNMARCLIFLHGLGTTHESWLKQIDYFSSKNYQVIALDLPGFGKSYLQKGAFSLAVTGECISLLLDSLDIKKTIIVGHSMGGAFAVYCCLHFPQYFEKCILINSFARIRPTSVSSAFAFTKRFVMANIQNATHQVTLITRNIFPMDVDNDLHDLNLEQIQTIDQAVYRDAVNLIAKINLQNEIEQITIPTLIMTGMDDHLIPPRLQKELFIKIPQAVQVMIKNGRHGMIFSHAGVINVSMEAFINYDGEEN